MPQKTRPLQGVRNYAWKYLVVVTFLASSRLFCMKSVF